MSQVEPVRVHIAGDDTGGRQSPRRKSKRSVPSTVTLTPDTPMAPLLPAGDRKYALMMAVDADTWWGTNQSDVARLTGTMVPQGEQWVIEHDGAVYVAAAVGAGTTVRVSVSAVYEE